MNSYIEHLKLRPNNTTSCEVISLLNPKTNLLFLFVSLFSFISCFFSIPAKKISFSFSHILQSYSEIENNNKNTYTFQFINNNLIIYNHVVSMIIERRKYE